MLRGEIWWAKLPPPVGRRPVQLLSRNKAYAVRNAVKVAEVTTTIRGIPVEVELNQDDGIPKQCVVNLDTLATFRKDLLETRISTFNDEKTTLVHQTLQFALADP